MGFRFRQSFSVIPGVRVNVSKTGIGFSAGVPGARYTVRADGSHAVTTSIPGTGLSHVETVTRKAPSSAPKRTGERIAGVLLGIGIVVGGLYWGLSQAHAAQGAEPPADLKKAIVAKCEKDYPDNYVMQSLCLKTQVDGWKEVQAFKEGAK